jgi:hypothetical protein
LPGDAVQRGEEIAGTVERDRAKPEKSVPGAPGSPMGGLTGRRPNGAMCCRRCGTPRRARRTKNNLHERAGTRAWRTSWRGSPRREERHERI